MQQNVFLSSAAGQRLYEAVRDLPIVDYHCHLSPQEIYEDQPFSDLAQLWLGGDHYKWRLMRAFGIDERYITGDAPGVEKFRAYAECIGLAAGNPLYHWTHMELTQFFHIDTPLNRDTADEIWEAANRVIRQEQLSPRKLIQRSGVVYIGTTDDPAEPLEYHRLLAEDAGFPVQVAPSFRTDRLVSICAPGYAAYVEKFAAATGVPVTDLNSFRLAISTRLDQFAKAGCRFTDVGIPDFPAGLCSDAQAAGIFGRALAGQSVEHQEYLAFLTYLYIFLAGEYRKRNMVMQLHLAVTRNANSALYEQLGVDCGGDCVGDMISQQQLVALLDGMQRTGGLPRTIVYTLNPAMYMTLATAAGSFLEVTLGAAWWFNDHKSGIEEQLRIYAETSHLAMFTGMLTDSRSFLSYARHDYFRRILCNLVGQWLESGEFAACDAAMELVRRVCYENSARLAGISV